MIPYYNMFTTSLSRLHLNRLLNRTHSEICKRSIFSSARQFSSSNSTSSSKTDKDDFELDPNPVKFSTSEAAKWKAAYTRIGSKDEDEMPDIQPYIVTFSIAAFLIYFLVLREESDLDEKFDFNFNELTSNAK